MRYQCGFWRCASTLRYGVAAVCALTASLIAESAGAQPPGDECVYHYEQSQVDRMEGRYLKARDAARLCSQESCPDVIRGECLTWLGDLDREIPSVVFRAVSDRGDESDVRVLLDGEVLLEALDGLPFRLDPGAYDLRFELDGHEPVTAHVVLTPGVRNREIVAEFTSKEDVAAAVPVHLAPVRSRSATRRPIPTTFYWLLGTTGLSAAAAGTMGAWALVEKDRADCSPGCPDSKSDSIAAKALTADILWGVTGVAAASAATVLLTRPRHAESRGARGGSLQVLLSPSPGGAQLMLRGER